MSVPTRGETYSRLIEHLRLAQEDAAMMAHIENADQIHGSQLAKAWLVVEELLKRTQHNVTNLAKRGFQ